MTPGDLIVTLLLVGVGSIAGVLCGVWLSTVHRRPGGIVMRRHREGVEQRRQWRDAR